MNKQNIIQNTIDFVKTSLADAEGGHDWWHVYRVWRTAQHIAQYEEVDIFIVELGALLHDIADSKFHDGDEEIGPLRAREFLQSLQVDENVIAHIEAIISNISFKGGKLPQQFKSPELDVIQDADRLDALGAVGIFRAVFSMGALRMLKHATGLDKGNSKKTVYIGNPIESFNEYMKYKPFIIPEKLNTDAAKKIAEERLKIMRLYLEALNVETGIDEKDLQLSEPISARTNF